MEDYGKTMSFNSEIVKRENIKEVMLLVRQALTERGYDSINQISGYLISNDPAYISSHLNARTTIQSLDRYDIIEELVRYYFDGQSK